MNCTLLFPNYEVAIAYKSMFEDWFKAPPGQEGYARFLRDLLIGNIGDFTKRLKALLKTAEEYLRLWLALQG